MDDLQRNGYRIEQQIVGDDVIQQLRNEAERVAMEAGSACVRHLCHRSDCFRELSQSSGLLDLLPTGMVPVRSILFDKTPDENWPVAWHQDLTIAVEKEHKVDGYGPWSRKDSVTHVQPPVELLERMVTIRLHLDDTPARNGALRVIPGSHRAGRFSSDSVIDPREAVDCECAAGDALIMVPLILHSSRRAERPTRRRILHFEYARASDLTPPLQWFE